MFFTFLQVASLALTLEAAIYPALGNISLTPQDIAKISTMQWDYSVPVLKSLAKQSACTWAGIILLVLAFAFQGGSIWRRPTIDELGAAHPGGLAAGIALALVLGGIAWWCAKLYEARSVAQARDLAEQNRSTYHKKPRGSGAQVSALDVHGLSGAESVIIIEDTPLKRLLNAGAR